jgi:hypothetical protein
MSKWILSGVRTAMNVRQRKLAGTKRKAGRIQVFEGRKFLQQRSVSALETYQDLFRYF